MRRLAFILLAAVFLTLGSGALEYAHNLHHAEQDARASSTPAENDQHDTTNCFLHALLRAPLMTGGWTPLLICIGLFVAFLTLLSPRPAALRFFTRLDCRGPPAALLLIPA